MSKDNDKRNNNDGGFGAVFLIIVVLTAMAFVGGGDQPLDRLADLIMICVWVTSIALLIFVIFFIIAYSMQTAMSDLYEALLEDFEHSPVRTNIERYKAIFDEKILGRTYKPRIIKKKQSKIKADDSPPQIKVKPKKKKPLTKEERAQQREREIEEEIHKMMSEEQDK